jgi:pentatricopeptide repeat protein
MGLVCSLRSDKEGGVEKEKEDLLCELLVRAQEKSVARQTQAVQSEYLPLGIGSRGLQSWQAFYDRERFEAEALVAELMGHPPERQALLIQNSARFHTWGVYSRLLDLSWAESIQSSGAAEHLARLALLLADQLDASLYRTEAVEDLRARAWAYIGNMRRQRSDLAGADEALRTAAEHLRLGTGDPIEKALILDLKASLKRAQRKFGRAMSLLKRAHTIFLAAGDPHRAGRALINMATILHDSGSPEQGIPVLYQALELIDPLQEPWLLICVWHNLIDSLAEAGRVMEARRLFRKARALYRRFPEAVTQNRRMWVAGKIARGLGQDKEAEALFLEARASFLQEDTPFEVALVSLDLAALYAKQGRTEEIQRLAAEIVPVFSSRQVHREALAALAFWKQAVETETARRERIADIVADVASFLKRARYDPELRFTAPAPQP